MDKDEALKLALETLESIQAVYPCETVGKRITAIKQALAAPVQEPVKTGDALFRQFMAEADKAGITHWPTPPAAQRQWVGLTNDEINEFAAGCHLGNSVQGAIYKAEAKLKEKNT